jgi:hypothetical protein
LHRKSLDGETVMGRHKDYFGTISGRESLDHFEAAETGHLHIQKYEIRMIAIDDFESLYAIAALPNDFDSAVTAEQQAQAFASKDLVIDDRYAQLRHDLRSTGRLIAKSWADSADRKCFWGE